MRQVFAACHPPKGAILVRRYARPISLHLKLQLAQNRDPVNPVYRTCADDILHLPLYDLRYRITIKYCDH